MKLILGGSSIACLWMLLGLSCLFSNPASANEPDNAPNPSIKESPITATDRDHWALQPITRPDVPSIRSAENALNGIDRFIQGRLEGTQLQPAPPAPRRSLIRRLKFDLLGLPPLPEEVGAFLQDENCDAYEQLVERYLASAAYGERWAQHWLDLARFAETDGFEHDKVRQGAWKYRDWVINALNSDMSYDKFVRSQLAGDLMPRANSQIATMFCMAGPDMPDINEQDLRRHDKLNELASTVGAGILGLQFHCAQCHDHKYDPISQADFYRLRAVFEPSVPLMKRDRHVLVLERQDEPQPGRLYHRGELKGAGPTLSAGLPRLALLEGESHLCESDTPRLEFCDWLFSRSNPLTARVICNRIWQHHFGKSLTENPSDFGVVAAGPTHPQLLDWLACELMDSGWSIKHIHRLILTSATYRQSARPRDPEQIRATDPENELYSHFPRHRLEGELIRDAMLAISGRLDRSMGGESVFPPLPPELQSTLLKGQWKTSLRASDHCRRSIYTFARRNLRYPIFDVFDRPDAGASCAVRGHSTTAIQSLYMLNSDFTLACARSLSRLLLSDFDIENAEQRSLLIDNLFEKCLGRPARLAEMNWFDEHLTSEGDWEDNLISACVAVFNSSEFIYVD